MFRRIIVTTPATTANLGIGFDCLGMALSLYNEYAFEESKESKLIDFGEYTSFDENLVWKSYTTYFEITNQPVVPVHITLLKQQIPPSRGLGSSASCIVAGVMAAHYMAKEKVEEEKLLQMMIELEGHPDNVAPCYFGGLVCSVKEKNQYYFFRKKVNPQLNFRCFIPAFELETSLARKVLPRYLEYKDVVSNLSRAFVALEAFEKGELSLLKMILKDEIHEKYRYPLINEGYKIQKQCEGEGLPMVISGAGPTLLALGDNSIDEKLKSLSQDEKWHIVKVTIAYEGVKIND